MKKLFIVLLTVVLCSSIVSCAVGDASVSFAAPLYAGANDGAGMKGESESAADFRDIVVSSYEEALALYEDHDPRVVDAFSKWKDLYYIQNTQYSHYLDGYELTFIDPYALTESDMSSGDMYNSFENDFALPVSLTAMELLSEKLDVRLVSDIKGSYSDHENNERLFFSRYASGIRDDNGIFMFASDKDLQGYESASDLLYALDCYIYDEGHFKDYDTLVDLKNSVYLRTGKTNSLSETEIFLGKNDAGQAVSELIFPSGKLLEIRNEIRERLKAEGLVDPWDITDPEGIDLTIEEPGVKYTSVPESLFFDLIPKAVGLYLTEDRFCRDLGITDFTGRKGDAEYDRAVTAIIFELVRLQSDPRICADPADPGLSAAGRGYLGLIKQNLLVEPQTAGDLVDSWGDGAPFGEYYALEDGRIVFHSVKTDPATGKAVDSRRLIFPVTMTAAVELESVTLD